MPAVGKLVGRLSVHEAAQGVIDTIESGDDVHAHGRMMQAALVLHGWWPWLMDTATRLSGWTLANSGDNIRAAPPGP